jgi:hypothetical protein
VPPARRRRPPASGADGGWRKMGGGADGITPRPRPRKALLEGLAGRRPDSASGHAPLEGVARGIRSRMRRFRPSRFETSVQAPRGDSRVSPARPCVSWVPAPGLFTGVLAPGRRRPEAGVGRGRRSRRVRGSVACIGCDLQHRKGRRSRFAWFSSRRQEINPDYGFACAAPGPWLSTSVPAPTDYPSPASGPGLLSGSILLLADTVVCAVVRSRVRASSCRGDCTYLEQNSQTLRMSACDMLLDRLREAVRLLARHDCVQLFICTSKPWATGIAAPCFALASSEAAAAPSAPSSCAISAAVLICFNTF